MARYGPTDNQERMCINATAGSVEARPKPILILDLLYVWIDLKNRAKSYPHLWTEKALRGEKHLRRGHSNEGKPQANLLILKKWSAAQHRYKPVHNFVRIRKEDGSGRCLTSDQHPSHPQRHAKWRRQLRNTQWWGTHSFLHVPPLSLLGVAYTPLYT